MYTGSNLAHDQPDITVVHKSSPITYLIDITILGDSRLHQKFVGKKEGHSDLCILLNKLWKTSHTIVPVVLGSLGTIPFSLNSEL